MPLFSIETAPVPLNAETYIREKREYTQIIPETELIALTENNYIPLTQAQISLCAKCKALLPVSLVVHIVLHSVGEYYESVPLDHTGSYVLSA